MKKTPLKQSTAARPPRGPQPKSSPLIVEARHAGSKPAIARGAGVAAPHYSWAAAEKPHQISPNYLPLAWKSLGLDPYDYMGLDPVLANALIPISIEVGYQGWPQLWQAACKFHFVNELPALYEDFYVNLDWMLEDEDESLAMFENMTYYTIHGRHSGYVELVRTGYRKGMGHGRLGLRAIARCPDLDGWYIIDPLDPGYDDERDDFGFQV